MSTFTRRIGASHPNQKLSDEEWLELIRLAYEDGSDESIQSICDRNGISRGRFYAKRQQLLKRQKQKEMPERAGSGSTNSEAGGDGKSLPECTSQSSKSTNEENSG